MKALCNLTDVDVSTVVNSLNFNCTPMCLMKDGYDRLDVGVNVEVSEWTFLEVILADIPINGWRKDQRIVSCFLDHLGDEMEFIRR